MHSCIFAYTVVEEIFRGLGISGIYPLTVKPIIYNPKLTDDFDQEIVFNPSVLPYKEFVARGYALLELGQDGQVPGRWPAHLVAIVPNTFNGNAALLDLTLEQFDRPEIGIKLFPSLANVSNLFLSAEEAHRLTMNECAVIYQAKPQDSSFFKKTGLWTNRTKQKLTSQAILSKL